MLSISPTNKIDFIYYLELKEKSEYINKNKKDFYDFILNNFYNYINNIEIKIIDKYYFNINRYLLTFEVYFDGKIWEDFIYRSDDSVNNLLQLHNCILCHEKNMNGRNIQTSSDELHDLHHLINLFERNIKIKKIKKIINEEETGTKK